MRRLHVLSAIGYFIGVGLVVLAPHPTAPVGRMFDHTGTTLLYAGFFMLGLSHGLVEGVINPLDRDDLQRREDQAPEHAARVVAGRAWSSAACSPWR